MCRKMYKVIKRKTMNQNMYVLHSKYNRNLYTLLKLHFCKGICCLFELYI